MHVCMNAADDKSRKELTKGPAPTKTPGRGQFAHTIDLHVPLYMGFITLY